MSEISYKKTPQFARLVLGSQPNDLSKISFVDTGKLRQSQRPQDVGVVRQSDVRYGEVRIDSDSFDQETACPQWSTDGCAGLKWDLEKRINKRLAEAASDASGAQDPITLIDILKNTVQIIRDANEPHLKFSGGAFSAKAGNLLVEGRKLVPGPCAGERMEFRNRLADRAKDLCDSLQGDIEGFLTATNLPKLRRSGNHFHMKMEVDRPIGFRAICEPQFLDEVEGQLGRRLQDPLNPQVKTPWSSLWKKFEENVRAEEFSAIGVGFASLMLKKMALRDSTTADKIFIELVFQPKNA